MDASAAEPNSHNQVAASRLARGVFVGRERELDVLRGGLERSAAGRGSVFMVVGEPGVGKTALLDEFSVRVRESGLLVVWGRCWESGGAPAYWPWVQVIRSCLQGQGAEARSTDGSAGPVDFTQILPDAQRASPRDTEPELPSSFGQEQARFALFDSVTT